MKQKRGGLVWLVALCLVMSCWAVLDGTDPAEAAGAGPVNINTASAKELVKLPRVGSTVADRIVLYRKEHGSFKKVEDLKGVKGIGEKTFEKIRP